MTVGNPAVDMVIVGAGFGGIAAAVKARAAGLTFVLAERSRGVGGTWWDNSYPGCEVDVPSNVYSFGFRPHDFTRTHVRQPELQAYLEDTVASHGLWPHVRLETEVTEARWLDNEHVWSVLLANGETQRCSVLVSAVGFLNHPNVPRWPGLEQFEGPWFHTSRWDHGVNIAGRRVAVVGTGSSACQVVPEIAGLASTVLVFQREAPWVLPKEARDLTADERTHLRRPLQRRLARVRELATLEINILRRGWTPGTPTHARREKIARGLIDRQLGHRPDLVEQVTPAYTFPGKRPVFTSTYYPALARDDVRLVPQAVVEVRPHAIVDASGEEWPVDVLILATGFEATNYLPGLEVFGRHGRELHDVWAGEPSAFLGLTVPGFPNFFMLYGPNTNGLEIVSNLVRQAEYAVRIGSRIRRGRADAYEVRPAFHDAYNRWLQARMQKTSWTTANNYFKSASGRIVTQWPYGALLYAALTKCLGPLAERPIKCHRRGALHRRL